MTASLPESLNTDFFTFQLTVYKIGCLIIFFYLFIYKRFRYIMVVSLASATHET